MWKLLALVPDGLAPAGKMEATCLGKGGEEPSCYTGAMSLGGQSP